MYIYKYIINIYIIYTFTIYVIYIFTIFTIYIYNIHNVTSRLITSLFKFISHPSIQI